jgi:hypothetical protein
VGAVGYLESNVSPTRVQMTVTELQDALGRLYLLPDSIGPVPHELMAFMRMTLHERDAGSARLARFLKETVHVES